MPRKEEIQESLKKLQDDICTALEKLDGKASFHEDIWERTEGGGGRSRIMQDGNVFEKAGVNFSAVHGKAPDFLKKESGSTDSGQFLATGISIVIHPKSPMVPIIHMNVRYFEMGEQTSWVGGGIDLTPHYIVKEDAHYFHLALKELCDRFSGSYYPEFKKNADDYFFIPHRHETRGIGGIFFDKLEENDQFTMSERIDFILGLAAIFIPVYTHLVSKNKDLPFGEQEKQWQLLRRGRYVEFNLVYDRGTKFGLETNGRTESILMSLPKMASWLYDFKPSKNSEEENTQQQLKKGIDWLS
jgi:coproporphyrinogen III oxidase